MRSIQSRIALNLQERTIVALKITSKKGHLLTYYFIVLFKLLGLIGVGILSPTMEMNNKTILLNRRVLAHTLIADDEHKKTRKRKQNLLSENLPPVEPPKERTVKDTCKFCNNTSSPDSVLSLLHMMKRSINANKQKSWTELQSNWFRVQYATVTKDTREHIMYSRSTQEPARPHQLTTATEYMGFQLKTHRTCIQKFQTPNSNWQ